MSIISLKGLKGLSGLSVEDQERFLQANADKLQGFTNLYKRDKFANVLYMNQKFINTFGQEAFDKLNDGSLESFNQRNQLLRNKVIEDSFVNTYSPYVKGKRDNTRGLGADWEKYNNNLSIDAKEQLLNSGYKTDNQLDKEYKERTGIWNNIVDFFIGEPKLQYNKDANAKILQNIYDDDVENEAKGLTSEVAKTYFGAIDNNLSDDAIRKVFYRAITPGSYTDANGNPNLGVADFAARFGNGDPNKISSEMKDFSIDDMRWFIAKKAVYDKYMTPERAALALNNDAKRYLADHQGSFKKLGLLLNDIYISALSYSADKINGIYNLGLIAADKMGDRPIVWVNDKSEIIDPNKYHLVKDKSGRVFYTDTNGQMHFAHQEEISRSTLHNMGKNFDGSDDDGILNPIYWSKAEQYGTLDEKEQKQYEKLGASPYKVVYNPGEDTDLMYEAFKMASFGIADAASMLIPFGIGTAGKTLSTLSKAGKVVNGLGKALNTSAKYLTFETKAGRLAQGSAGALGIAYAYNRGAFQETLAKNLALMDEKVMETSQQNIYNLYHTNAQYKANIDNAINKQAAVLKAQYMSQIQKDRGMQVADERAIDKMMHAKAQDIVLHQAVQNDFNKRKQSPEYQQLQEKAINGAGDAAVNTFFPEAIKYALVNNFGHRKFLYTNPAGLSKRVSSSLKGIKEITVGEGKNAKKRLTVGSKFNTWGNKWKEFGKTLASQAWGGAWTNGTDDMQVDAAERINDDSFNRYLQAYQSGEALADTYSFADGLYSYIKGLHNSMGQTTTWNAAAVGGLGGIVNIAPHFANIASLATKEGRDAYKNNYWREIERDDNGIAIKDKKGNIKYKDLGKFGNLREQLNFFIQNGILNTYYGKKQSERALQNHADFVNNLLDQYDDFVGIEKLIASNIAKENVINEGDKKTQQFIQALHAVSTLNNLANNVEDPTILSSTIEKAKTLIDRASQLADNNKEGFTEDELKELLSEYYASNPNIPQSEESAEEALKIIAKNANILKEASEAYDEAEIEIQNIEKNRTEPINPIVRDKLKWLQALNSHWQDRYNQMREEINDISNTDTPTDPNVIIATVGGRERALDLSKVYQYQLDELNKALEEQRKETTKRKEFLDDAKADIDDIAKTGDSNMLLEAKTAASNAEAKYQSSLMQEDYYENLIARTEERKNSFENSVKAIDIEQAIEDYDNAKVNYANAQNTLDENESNLEYAENNIDTANNEINKLKNSNKYKRANKKQREALVNKLKTKLYKTRNTRNISKQEVETSKQNVETSKQDVETKKEKVLTADEIFALDPVTRAKMLRRNIVDAETGEVVDNRKNYSREQIKEIEELEKRLPADALDKIQDIALLQQRIDKNKDAYRRISQNPEAAAWAFEIEREDAAREAVDLINFRNALAAADTLNTFYKEHKDNSPEEVEKALFDALKVLNTNTLEIIKNKGLMPNHEQLLNDALDRTTTLQRLELLIQASDKTPEQKKMLSDLIYNTTKDIRTSKDIITTLEQIAKDTKGDNTNASVDINDLLNKMTRFGFQRNATITESKEAKAERKDTETKVKAEKQERDKQDAIQKAEAKAKAEESSTGSTKEDLSKEDIETQNATEQHLNSFEKEINVANANKMAESAKKAYEKQGLENAQPSQEVAADGSNITPNMEKAEDVKLSNNSNNTTEAKKDTREVSPTIEEEILKNVNLKKEGLIEEEELVGNTNKSSESPKLKEDEIDKNAIGKPYANSSPKNTENSSNNKVASTEIHKEDNGEENIEVTPDMNLDNPQIEIIDKDTIKVKPKSIEDQVKEDMQEDPSITETIIDKDLNAEAVIDNIEISTNTDDTLSGMAMSRYDSDFLNGKNLHGKNNGTNNGGQPIHYTAVERKGRYENDSMNILFQWLDNHHIKLDNIVNLELSKIIAEKPHTKFKFAMTEVPNTTGNSERKELMLQGKLLVPGSHLFLVIDYNDTVAKYHNPDNGGIIENTVNGEVKKYLIVGVVGYGSSTSTLNEGRQARYNFLFNKNPNTGPLGILVSQKDDQGYYNPAQRYFVQHPNDIYYVNDVLTTEMIPGTLTPGFIVKAWGENSKEEYSQHVSISSLLENKGEHTSNPMNYTWKKLVFGISERTAGLVTTKPIDMYSPKKEEDNIGRSFIMIPSGNGKSIPCVIDPIFYNELAPSTLKDNIDTTLNNLIDLDYQTRLDAAIGLYKYLYLDPEKDFILLSKNKNLVTLMHENSVIATIAIDPNDLNSTKQALDQAVEKWHPRVNITMRVLNDSKLLKQYDEAGALKTDIKYLGTLGTTYSIYPIVENNNTYEMSTAYSRAESINTSSSDDINKKQVIYKGGFYEANYNADDTVTFTKDGKEVTNSKEKRDLPYLLDIISTGKAPSNIPNNEANYDFYILENTSKPKVIKVNRKSKEVTVLRLDNARNYITKYNDFIANKDRDNKATKKLQSLENVDILSESKTDDTTDTFDSSLEGDASMPTLDDIKKSFDLESELREGEDIDNLKSDNIDNLIEGEILDMNNSIRVLPSITPMQETPIKEKTKEVKDNKEEKKEKEDNTFIASQDSNKKEVTIIDTTGNKESTKSFTEIYEDPSYFLKIDAALIKVFKSNIPNDIKDIIALLKSKNIKVEGIDASKKGIEAWIKTIEDCR